MSATQNGPQVSGSSGPQVSGSDSVSGAGGGNGHEDHGSKIRKFEAVIILLVGLVAALVVGIASRTWGDFSYFGAVSLGVVAGFSVPGFIIMFIKYVRNQS
ncbi:hypothetical protein [Streptomyces canus]|uniref:hypothetical protein n=1 Tax=Streptomyces canus TaxID=58343 RepID=UPI002783FEFC|nr:hypothetical protein [Streptomyces canus]MDQ1068349.1 hypothetical protein [Streptomyces canus]